MTPLLKKALFNTETLDQPISLRRVRDQRNAFIHELLKQHAFFIRNRFTDKLGLNGLGRGFVTSVLQSPPRRYSMPTQHCHSLISSTLRGATQPPTSVTTIITTTTICHDYHQNHQKTNNVLAHHTGSRVRDHRFATSLLFTESTGSTECASLSGTRSSECLRMKTGSMRASISLRSVNLSRTISRPSMRIEMLGWRQGAGLHP